MVQPDSKFEQYGLLHIIEPIYRGAPLSTCDRLVSSEVVSHKYPSQGHHTYSEQVSHIFSNPQKQCHKLCA